jgi:hypothetical protein
MINLRLHNEWFYIKANVCNKYDYELMCSMLHYFRLEMQWSMMTQIIKECMITLLATQSYQTKQHLISTNFVISHQFLIKLLNAMKQQVKFIRTHCSLMCTTFMLQYALITTSLLVPRRSRWDSNFILIFFRSWLWNREKLWFNQVIELIEKKYYWKIFFNKIYTAKDIFW